MSTIREIQNRVILVDYYPGSHGHFLIDTLHSMLYADLNEDREFRTNYHLSKLTPSIFLQGAYPEKTFLDFEFDEKILQKFSNNKHIFWPAHWSLHWLHWYNKKMQQNQLLPDLRSHINDIQMIEIYVPKEIWPRHYINYWFNIGIYSHEQLSNNDFFIENFYAHCQQIQISSILQTDIAKTITLTPYRHKFTRSEILSMIEEHIFMNHGFSYNLQNTANYRTLNKLQLPNKILSISMENFYNFDLFKTTILNIKDFFKLDCQIDDAFLTNKWNKFINVQQPINVYNNAIADNNLTLIEQAYRNFLNKCK